jgi:hypothetical protein
MYVGRDKAEAEADDVDVDLDGNAASKMPDATT